MSDGPWPRLGGMALRNGLLVHGPTHWAAAVRGAGGDVTVRSGRKPRLVRGPVGSVPLVRGVLRLAEALAVLPAVRTGTPGARFAVESPAAGAGVVVSLVGGAVSRRVLRSPVAQEVAAAFFGVVPAIATLRGSDAAAWHAVEHKSIAAYEAGGPDAVADAAAHPKEHERCGSNLVLPLVVTNTLANVAVRTLAPRAGTGTRAAAACVGAGLAVEALVFSLAHPRHPLSRALAATGHAIQARFVTREPDAATLDVGRRAMDALLDAEGVARGDG